MPLTNFGSILNFAEQIETKDSEFYAVAAGKSGNEAKGVFDRLSKDCAKNRKTVQRIRRENVTEMILEGVKDLSRTSFDLDYGDIGTMDSARIIKKAQEVEDRADRFYSQSAEKIKALSEVSRELKTLGKKRRAQKNSLDEI